MRVMNGLYRQWLRLLSVVVLLGMAFAVTGADRMTGRSSLDDARPELRSLKLDNPLSVQSTRSLQSSPTLDSSLLGATGMQRVIVHLKMPATASMGEVSARRNYKYTIESEQNAFVGRCMAGTPSIRVLGRVQHVLNAVFMDVPARALAEIAADPDVLRIAPVGHYEMDLSETVPYVGAATVQAAGLDGSGISVAVLDSGVDYTHADLGGSGDPADYANNDGSFIEPGTFPTAKVVGGFDFLGNVWPLGPNGSDDPPMPDPDPMDDLALVPGAFAGHGTHVADIIGGVNGVAPGADIYAVKVCASLANSCNGISLILGMEFSVDPNGDGDTDDRVDIINMSLGATYGQPFDDDLSAAVDNASALGVLTVSSAGNCGDAPYCTGTPSSAPTALSVAQTQVPSAIAFLMNVVEPEAAAGLYDAIIYPWTPNPVSLISSVVQYGDLDGSNLNGCAPFTGDLTGLIVAVDRGACNFSDKIRNIENAGGSAGIVMLIAPGAPFAGGFGGGPAINIPGFNISQVDGDILRAGNALVQFGPEFSAPLVGISVGSTARGPDMSFNAIKPEIGAPGASVSAEVATGTVRTPFGGTSGASPMVAGAAALLQQACRAGGDDDDGRRAGCSPLELKALLMNNAFRDIISDTTGELTEITRIGGGELRVDASAAATFLAFSPDDNQPSLGLGFADVHKPITIRRSVKVQNLSDQRRKITVTPTFRFADDEASRAVRVLPKKRRITLRAHGSKHFTVFFRIDPRKLGGNAMNSGGDGNNPAALKASEFDGYLLLQENGGEEVAMPWHILPRQAARVQADRQTLVAGATDSIGLVNKGAGIAQNDAYSIIGLSDEMPRGGEGLASPTPDLRAVAVNTLPVDSSFCSAEFLWSFAINTWDRQTHLVPVSHVISFDIDRDGVDDYQLLNRDVTFDMFTDGRQLSWVVDLSTGTANALFFVEHATNTGNTVLLACGEQLGLSAADALSTNVDISVVSQDIYYGGPGDAIDGITITPFGERFLGQPSGDLPARTAGTLEVTDFGNFPGSSAQSGVLLLTNGDRGAGAHGGATEATEALLFLAEDVDPPMPLPADDDDDDDDDDDNDDD